MRDNHLCDGTTPAYDRHDVVQRSAVGTGHDGNAGRQHRDRALSLGREQGFRLELLAQLLERLAPQPIA